MAKTTDKAKVWVLGYHINECDQQDEAYFLGIYFTKPTAAQLQKDHRLPREEAELCVANGGGRIGTRDVWFLLSEVEEGVGGSKKHRWRNYLHCEAWEETK